MKKYFFSIATAAFLMACNSNPKTDTTTTPTVIATDTASRMQADKNQSVQMNGVSDTIIGSDGQVYIKSKPGEAAQPVAPAPVRSTVKTHSVKTHTSSGSGAIHTTSTNNTSTTTSPSTTGTGTSGTTTNTGTTTTTTTTTPAPEPQKKGWSSAAKGTAIGAASGAVAGAIISKNKGVGAVVGGLLGAGGGYIIGHKKDKKKAAADTTGN